MQQFEFGFFNDASSDGRTDTVRSAAEGMAFKIQYIESSGNIGAICVLLHVSATKRTYSFNSQSNQVF
jgi:hypothetical protein